MKQISIPLFLVFAFLINCSSKNNEARMGIHDHHYTITANRPKPEDSLVKSLVFDTTLVFTSTKELNEYKKQVDEKIKKVNLQKSAINSFTIDSIKKLNEDLFTLVAFHRVINTQQDIYLLLYNIDFSSLVTIDNRMNAFNALPEPIKNSNEGKKILERLNIKYYSIRRNIGLELPALPSFQLLDSSKRSYFLSDLFPGTHPYTLLIFSASWCVPCRYEGLDIKRQFSKIDPSQLKIITVSVDKDVQKWKKAIIADACPWMQLWMPGDFDAGLTKALNITKIPANVLFNKERKIIAQNSNVNEIFLQFPELFTR